VKRKLGASIAVAGACAMAAACGYEPLYGAHQASASEPSLAVLTPATRLAPDAAAASALEAGARAALARAGKLRSGSGYPRLELELLRIDDTSEGIARVNELPLARATRVAVVARGWVETAKDAPAVRDSGDLRAIETVSTEGGDARLESLRRDAAIRAAARRLGDRMGRLAVGEPIAPDEGI
jgi:hypothetical protein